MEQLGIVMTKPVFSEYLDFLNATAALRGVDLNAR
jgi:hypothetical protein